MKKKWLFLIPLVAITLSGCAFLRSLIFGSSSELVPVHYNYPDPVVEPDIDGRSICRSFSYNLKDVLVTTGQKPLNSVGTAKLLVVPVQLKGSSYRWNTYRRDEVRKCFFGKTEEVGWESVSSYYNKSSFGQLTIEGQLSDTFVSSYTFSQLNEESHPDRLIVKEFESSDDYDKLRHDYDTNGDGFIDAVSFIYAEPIRVNSSSNDMRWWAFVYTNDSGADTTRPNVNQYMWASYFFCQKADRISNPHGGAYDLDAHTYIHESGHLFGLDDYYSYADNNEYDPSGGQEMHSQNIGDENIYSKLALGWVQPYYVKTDTSVTTTLYASSYYDPKSTNPGEGKAIIINDNWNQKSPMDEYLILEYYSPTVLNKKDSEQDYAKNARMFQTSGFRLYHVDSRLVAYTKYGQVNYSHRLDEIDPNYYCFIGASNTPEYPYSRLNNVTEIKNFKLLHLIQSGGTNTFKNGDKARDADLFKEGSSFVASSSFFYYGTKFNGGNEVGYRIDFGKCDEENMCGTVTITKLH